MEISTQNSSKYVHRKVINYITFLYYSYMYLSHEYSNVYMKYIM